jgi:LPXTG-motif cell wall-anchored protein
MTLPLMSDAGSGARAGHGGELMRMALMRVAVFAALMTGMFWFPTNQFLAVAPAVAQGQQSSPTDAPTGPTPAPTGTATPAESSPPPPTGPSNTGTAQTDDSTPLLMGAAIILIVLLLAFYLWRRRRAVRDL